MRRGTVATALAVTALIAPLAVGSPAAAADGERADEGTLLGGAAYALRQPVDWEGALIVMPGRGNLDAPIADWLVSEGIGVIGYDLSDDWDLEQDRDNAAAARERFAGFAGATPETTIVAGRSQGGLTTRIVADAQPEWLDGALPMCGGGAGNISTWNYKLDTAFALRELVDPDSPMRITGIEDAGAELAAMNDLVAKAGASEEGRARAALAAALSKIPAVDRATGQPLPASDLDARIDRYLEHLPFAMGSHVRVGYERTVGGVFSWNTGVDYERALHESGRWPEVVAAYREAGLSLQDDLDTLAGAERLSADPAAVAFVERTSTFTGELSAPVLSLHTTGDGAGSTQDDEAYAQTVRAAGAAPLLRQLVVSADGHCTFTPGEEAVAIRVLLDRIETGRWSATSPAALERELTALQAHADIALGDARFVQQPRLGTPARPWDAGDWGTYRG
ncbi:hypothetical protein [Microbacterium sp. Marseille-Q6965]|uniref:hypothetical protein n=1 Tax=Microbacterium sp. Marseille-Q6965 TaxID=2965072 RepID=UPI0021B79ADC|nr:hypothetical protein [Microbacterium sp. Marseille-Q6965]